MTDKVFPSPDRDMTTKILGQIMEYAGGSDPGWVVPSGTAKIAGSARNGFGQSSSGASLDVTIDTGEAFVKGCWIDRDTTTTVTLATATGSQIIYVGLDLSMKNKIIVGLSAAFAATDPKMAIWTFDTDGSGVTNSTNERIYAPGRGLDVPNADNADNLSETVVIAGSVTGNTSESITIPNSYQAHGRYLYSVYSDSASIYWSADPSSSAMLRYSSSVGLTLKMENLSDAGPTYHYKVWKIT